jgi:hypothetical protein
VTIVIAALARPAQRALFIVAICTAICFNSAPSLADSARQTRDPNETLVFGPMKVSRWLAETIVRAADATGVDAAYLMALADKESSLLPASKAGTSTAEGLFQFLEATWLDVLRRYGPKHGFLWVEHAIKTVQGKPVVQDDAQRRWILNLRRDPYLSALMAGEMVNAQREILAGKAERDPSFSELYIAHFMGVRGASRFLDLLDDKPTATAAREFPRAAKANPSIFTEGRRKVKNLTMAEVRESFDAMIGSRVARYQTVRREVGVAVASN